MRDRFPDLLRSTALGAVILGHWTMAAVAVDSNGVLQVDNVLNINRFLWPVTWILMLIPLFFFVGGFSNATSMSRALARGGTANQWVRKRLVGMLKPVTPFVLVVLGIVWLALGLGAPKGLTLTVAVVVLMPLWFVIVYAVLAALTPAFWAAHQKYGIKTVVAMALLACLVDAARTALDEPYIGYLNYILVHGTMQQIGFFYFDGRLQRLSKMTLALWMCAAFAALCAIVATPIWSESMVGMSGERSNMSPPSIPSLLHGLWLIPLAMLAYPWLAQRIDGTRTARVLDIASRYSMRAFLWHLPVLVAVIGILLVFRTPFPEPGTASWWLTRPPMLALMALALWSVLRVGDLMSFRIREAKQARNTRRGREV